MSETLTGTATEQLWSVTHLIKKALGVGEPIVDWSVERTALDAVYSRKVVEAMIAQGTKGEEEAVDWLKQSRKRAMNKAQIRGTEVHAAAESLALGATPIVDPALMPYVEQLARWMDTFEPRYLMAEAPVYNLAERYAGTLDGVMELDGERLLFDYKTTDKAPDARSRPPYSEVALQLVAYARATEVGIIADRVTTSWERYYVYDPVAKREPMIEVDGALCIVVSPYDIRAIPVRIDDDVWRNFLYAKELAAWQKAGTRELFGPALVPRRDAAA